MKLSSLQRPQDAPRSQGAPLPPPEAHPEHLEVSGAPEGGFGVVRALRGCGQAYGRAQIHTPEFKRWFGASKVREPRTSSNQKLEDMPSLVVYHGTNQAISAFGVGRETVNTWTFGEVRTQRHGIFFAENPDFASTFAESRGGAPNIIPVYLHISNPFYMDGGSLSDGYAKSAQDLDRARASGDASVIEKAQSAFDRARYLYNIKDAWAVFDGEDGKAFVEMLKAEGYDGAFLEEEGHGLGEDAEPQVVWVVFSPAQIKSALGNSGAFDPNNPDIRA